MGLDPDEVKFWVGFSLIPGVGRVRVALLEREFGTLGQAWDATPEALLHAQLDGRTVESFRRRRSSIDVDAEMEKMGRLGVRPIIFHDPGYPELLREI